MVIEPELSREMQLVREWKEGRLSFAELTSGLVDAQRKSVTPNLGPQLMP